MSRRMLIVDDEETIRWALRELFMQEGWEVHCADDAEAGARMIDESVYDYLITDLKMAGGGGIELIRRARADNPWMGITVLTGYASLETAVEAVRLQAWDYVVKPCSAAALKARVEEFFRHETVRRSSTARLEPLGEGVLAEFLAGAGTELLGVADLGGPAGHGELFERLRRLFNDLGFSRKRCEDLVQCCVEAAAMLGDGGPYVSARAGAFRGHLVVALAAAGGAEGEPARALERVGEQFAVNVRLIGRDGERTVLLSEAIR